MLLFLLLLSALTRDTSWQAQGCYKRVEWGWPRVG